MQQGKIVNETSPLLQNPSINLATKSNARNAISFEERLIDAEIDTGEIKDTFSWRKLWKYTGPGLLMSIAYLDPGNLEADLQSGAVAGYSLLWLLLTAHIAGQLIQCLSARLGVVTGNHLAQLIRQYYPRPVSIVFWLITEIAIIGSDIQEIVGTAIALKILFRIPLWVGTLLTAMDTFTFMLLQNYGVRKLEALFMVLISTMAICFWIEMFMSDPDVVDIIKGTLIPTIPRKAFVEAVAIIGAFIMPHNLYLHSALVMTRRTNNASNSKIKEANFYFSLESGIALFFSYLINMAIVTVFAKVFYSPNEDKPLPGLYDAADVLANTLGDASRYLWALGLLAAGSSSTITGTLAGQYVIEGFFGKIFKKPWHRLLITRSIALVPSMFVAVYSVNNFDNMGEILNVLQSLCLPTALIPLMKLTNSKSVMGKNFKTNDFWKYISWIITLVIIGTNLILFLEQLNKMPNLFLGYICGGIYFVFIVYITFLPIKETRDLLKINNISD
ncbi:natural resistance-associated macrophage protein [Rhizophagus diaphanus]|nr:natural resistance-associated macrophage protein [Rhizophagus diaphanus] [Rhizophagus sp. MUCL 43196]